VTSRGICTVADEQCSHDSDDPVATASSWSLSGPYCDSPIVWSFDTT